MTQEEFLIQHLIENKSYPLLLQENKELSLSMLQEWWTSGTEFRAKIRKSNALFTSRKGNPEFAAFERAGKRAFFEWFQRQPRVCAYCNIEEYKLEELFDTGALVTKKGRGRSLELEQRDTSLNLYSEDNCALACYFCHNHKSDIVSEKIIAVTFPPTSGNTWKISTASSKEKGAPEKMRLIIRIVLFPN